MTGSRQPASERGIRTVTVSVGDLAAALALYRDFLGYLAGPDVLLPAGHPLLIAWGLPDGVPARVVTLAAPGSRDGHVRLVALSPSPTTRLIDGARPWDHGYIKNLDVFTDHLDTQYARAVAAGYRFLAPPVTYRLPWGSRAAATEAHLPTDDGVKVSLARLEKAPRHVFGEANRQVDLTEIAAATQIVADYDRAVAFYRDVFGCVPAQATVIDDAALVAALRLPPATRLRMSFIGPPSAIGGKVGLVAYEGPGVGDARALTASAPAGARGAFVLTFDDDEVGGRAARAVAHGATWVTRPADVSWPGGLTQRVATVRSPDGVVLEIVSPPRAPARVIDVCASASLTDGVVLACADPDIGRVLVTRVRGELFAVADRCPHIGAPLSRGAMTGALVTCPWHGWQVDVTTGRVHGAGCERVTRHAVAEPAGRVVVEVDVA